MGRDPLLRAFGDVVRAFRLKRGISQEELADIAGLHRTYVSLIERGERNPSLKVMAALAHALGTTVSGLVARLDERRAEEADAGA